MSGATVSIYCNQTVAGLLDSRKTAKYLPLMLLGWKIQL